MENTNPVEVAETTALATVANDSLEVRAIFLKKTYLHLALALLGFVVVETIFLNTPWIVNIGLSMIEGMSWLLVLGGFMLVTSFTENWAKEATNKTHQYIALAIYVLAEAFIFVPLIYIAISLTGDYSLLRQAMVLCLFLFTGLSAVAFFSGTDFSMLKSVVFVGGLVALGLIVAGILFGFSLGLWFSFAMVGIAAGAILYKTSSIFHHYHSEQYVAASLGLFAAFMLLFWYVLDIVSRFSGD